MTSAREAQEGGLPDVAATRWTRGRTLGDAGRNFDGRELCEDHRTVLETEGGQREGHVGEGCGAFAVDEQRDLGRVNIAYGLKIFDQSCVHII